MNGADLLAALAIVCALLVIAAWPSVLRFAIVCWIRVDLAWLRWGQRSAGPGHYDSGYIVLQIAQREADLNFYRAD